MHYPHDDLYCDRTWFDAAGGWLVDRAGRIASGHRAGKWTVGFGLFAALCVAWAAGLATHAVVFDRVWNERAAELLAAALLLVAARHFLAATGMAAGDRLASRKPIVRRSKTAPVEPPATRRSAAGIESASANAAAASAQAFFRELREAGVNVRIAQSLHAAGFRNAAQVRQCSDAQLLATPGVGRATLGKLRARFGLPAASQSSSDAA